jgi:hypothetical protein
VTCIRLFHWNAAEGEACSAELRAAGFQVELRSAFDPSDLRASPPDAVVIDLRRSPSQGRDVGGALRRRKAMRAVPLVFVEGDPEKTARVRSLLPDAVYTPWAGVAAAIERAMREPPAAPIVPGTMDAYAGAPLPKKLGVKPGARVALFEAPARFESMLEGARFVRSGADVVLLFVRSHNDLERRFPVAARALAGKAGLWIVWPKKTSRLAAPGLNEGAVRRFGLAAGFVDFKICAVDETWSGLQFTRRG